MKLLQNSNIIALLVLEMASSMKANLPNACNATNKEGCNIRNILNITNRLKKAVDVAFWETPFDKDDENPLKNQNDYDVNDDDHEYETHLGETNTNDDHDIVDFYMKETKPSASLEEFYRQAKEDRETYQRLEKQRLSAKIVQFFHTCKEFLFKLFLLDS